MKRFPLGTEVEVTYRGTVVSGIDSYDTREFMWVAEKNTQWQHRISSDGNYTVKEILPEPKDGEIWECAFTKSYLVSRAGERCTLFRINDGTYRWVNAAGGKFYETSVKPVKKLY